MRDANDLSDPIAKDQRDETTAALSPEAVSALDGYFTHEDVVCLQDLATFVVTDSEYAKGVLSLAARIAALLPPDPTP